jgi:virulence-associated protein VapD
MDLKEAKPNIHVKGKKLILQQGYNKMQGSGVISQEPITFADCLIDVENVCRLYPDWNLKIRDIRILRHDGRSDITGIIKDMTEDMEGEVGEEESMEEEVIE